MSARSWQRKGVGRKADSLFAIMAALSGVLILLVLAYMVISTTATALPVFGSQGISFIAGSEWSPSNGQFGILAFIYGTVVTSVIALVIAVPLSLGVSLFLTEYSPRRLRGIIGYAVDLLAAVPSVIYGLWGVFILLPLFLQPTADFLSDNLGFIPIFKGPASGLSYFGAGVILAIMITPIITSLCREVFDTVPNADRQAAYALGATKWEMIRQAVLPRGRAGVVGATMLGLGRALGETIAVALLIGSSVKVDTSVLSPGYSMAAVIANQFQEATGDHIRALVGIGVVLFGLTIIINMGARALVWRFNRV
ncbi:MAG: phosphate ABC transporter permease subunit PstC [Actinobacteria bacterium RBG_16_64_13]|nr:MAG: phosphate ABC transporter permease subunit PstC [Actinobacteria bacterium RBG_16_64_13]